MEQTINEVVRATALALSIIIVGVGNEDFTMMHELDADETPLYSKFVHHREKRDIVQFIPFNEFRHDSRQLACEVLEEIPRQLLSFF